MDPIEALLVSMREELRALRLMFAGLLVALILVMAWYALAGAQQHADRIGEALVTKVDERERDQP